MDLTLIYVLSFVAIIALSFFLNWKFGPAEDLIRKLNEERAAHNKKLDAEYEAFLDTTVYVGKQTYTHRQFHEYGDVIRAYECGIPLEVFNDKLNTWQPLTITPKFEAGIKYRIYKQPK